MIDIAELPSRWERLRQVMERLDLDVVVAVDTSRDEILLSHQRWLTGFTPLGGPAGALVFRDGHVELLSPWLARTVPAFYAETGLPLEPVPGFSPELFAERVGRADPKRVGYIDGGGFPAGVHTALRLLPSSPELVDVTAEMTALRIVKSGTEIAAVRRSCAIADEVWHAMPELFRVGRKFHEVIADVDHIVRLQGGEGGFHLMMRLPVLGFSMDVLADPEEIRRDARYLVEVSPRYQGYYSQLTAPVTTTADDAQARAAFDAVIAAKAFAQPLMVPGADLTQIAAEVEGFIKDRGQVMASRSLGHFCGLGLEEPRHEPSRPCILQKDMTLIFHPVLMHPEMNSMMRADTYLITDGGAERLNTYREEMLVVG